MTVSGFNSHSARGDWGVVPVRTSNVAEYGAKVMLEDHDWAVPPTILMGEDWESVYEVTWLGVNPFSANWTAAARRVFIHDHDG